jgi:hypothetical protein
MHSLHATLMFQFSFSSNLRVSGRLFIFPLQLGLWSCGSSIKLRPMDRMLCLWSPAGFWVSVVTATLPRSRSRRPSEIMSLNCGHHRAFVHPPPQVMYEYGEPRWNDVDRGSRRTRRRTFPHATLFTTNRTRTDPVANPGLRGDRPATNHLRHSTATAKVFVETCSLRSIAYWGGTFCEAKDGWNLKIMSTYLHLVSR